MYGTHFTFGLILNISIIDNNSEYFQTQIIHAFKKNPLLQNKYAEVGWCIKELHCH